MKTRIVPFDGVFDFLMDAGHPASQVFENKQQLDWSTPDAMWGHFERVTGITRANVSKEQADCLFRYYSWVQTPHDEAMRINRHIDIICETSHQP
jgi:phenylalanine-4-hydroxylase